MIIADTSVVFAMLDAADAAHERVVEWYLTGSPSLVTTPLVLAEVDHLVRRRLGSAAAGTWRAQVVSGALAVEWWAHAEMTTVEVAERYADLGVGLTDASLVALGRRRDSNEIATLDQRHFRAMAPLTSHRAFRLLPADA